MLIITLCIEVKQKEQKSKKSGYILATSKGGRGSPLFYPLDPIIDYCPQKKFHNGEFGGNKLKIYFDHNNLFIRFTPFHRKAQYRSKTHESCNSV